LFVSCSHGVGSTRDDRRSRTTFMEMFSCCLCSGQHLTSSSTGDVSGLAACGAVYFEQLDRGSRHASVYVTTRAYDSPGYVTTSAKLTPTKLVGRPLNERLTQSCLLYGSFATSFLVLKLQSFQTITR